jgi:hypothetical protein
MENQCCFNSLEVTPEPRTAADLVFTVIFSGSGRQTFAKIGPPYCEHFLRVPM